MKAKKIEAVKNPILFQAQIGMIWQDAEPMQVLQINGERFGDTQGSKKIYLGGKAGVVRRWWDNYIEIEYPKIPILGKQFPVLIKNGAVLISNVRQLTLRAKLFSCNPSSINRRLIRNAIITLEAMYTGTGKKNIQVRFKRKMVPTFPTKKLPFQYYGKIISITLSAHYNTIKVLLPEKIPLGVYKVDIMQGNRVAATLPEGPVTLTLQ